MLWPYVGSASVKLMLSSSAATLHTAGRRQREDYEDETMHAAQRDVDSQGLVSRAGEVLCAQTGEEVWIYVRQEGQQFDVEPQLDVFWVLQVLLGQRWRLPSFKYLPEIRNELLEVLQDKKKRWLEFFCQRNTSRVWLSSLTAVDSSVIRAFRRLVSSFISIRTVDSVNVRLDRAAQCKTWATFSTASVSWQWNMKRWGQTDKEEAFF